MKLKKIDDSDGILKVEMEGEDHTLANLLRDECKGSVVSYRVAHPLTSSPEITVKDKNAKKVLAEAAKSIQSLCKEFSSKFK
ncbi:MAG: DNA-directed RNA polymerase subunit L [archaeon]